MAIGHNIGPSKCRPKDEKRKKDELQNFKEIISFIS